MRPRPEKVCRDFGASSGLGGLNVLVAVLPNMLAEQKAEPEKFTPRSDR
jgi:hypothetical protein